jgi:aldehyde:ferredoxin oxidoreductase
MGAVMGSKNLKAIAIKGTQSPPVANPEKLDEIHKRILKKIKESPFAADLRKHGQPSAIVPREVEGLLPIKNWSQDTWPEGAAKIGAPRFTERLQVKPWACNFCPIGCHRRLTSPHYAKDSESGGPEYETLGMIGSNLLIEDLDALVRANDLCNRYGIDTIEIGGVLGWAFEAYEKGWLTKSETDNIELKWGNADVLVSMIKKVAFREGFGDLLAEGITPCVQKYPDSKIAGVAVMNQAVAAHDPRAYFGQTITTIASTRGSCHLHGCAEAAEVGALLPELGIDKTPNRFESENKGYLGAIYQDVQQIWNSLITCFAFFFAGFNLSDQVEVLNAITDWDCTPQEIQKTGERIIAIQHIFNLRMGLIPKKHNIMPERLCKPHKTGGAAGKVPPWRLILADYWKTKDWPDGIPSKEKLSELGINDLTVSKLRIE